ncbi:hypothetical protein LXL04_034166 [Taraxacum kok-saghyz]
MPYLLSIKLERSVLFRVFPMNIFRQMASPLRRIGNQSSTAHRFVLPQLIGRFSTDALFVEYKAGEIGTVSGIPDEHLQMRLRQNYIKGHGLNNNPRYLIKISHGLKLKATKSGVSSICEPLPADRPIWFPGSSPPEWLDGSLPGDFGFDPLVNLSNRYRKITPCFRYFTRFRSRITKMVCASGADAFQKGDACSRGNFDSRMAGIPRIHRKLLMG